MQIFDNFREKSLKLISKAFQIKLFRIYLDTCSTFSIVCKKRLVNKRFEFLGIEKEYNKQFRIKGS